MKKLFLTAGIAILFQLLSAQYCGFSGPSMCSPSGVTQAPGLYPLSENLAPLVNGDVSSTVIQFQNWDTISFNGQHLTVASTRIDSIGNLPAGICWASNVTNNTFTHMQQGCIVLNGTTCAPPGQYRLKILITCDIGVPIATDAGAAGLYYYLRVKNSGDVDIAIDTTGQTANSNIFVAYGNIADCSSVLSANLGTDQTICTGSNITLNANAHAGQPPYTYNWSSTGPVLSCYTCAHPQLTLSQSSTYGVTVIDATGATVSDAITFIASAGTNNVQFSASNTDIDCAHALDTTVITVTGGASPYTVSWGDGGTSSGSSPLTHVYHQANAYVIAVQDNNNCVTSSANTVDFNGILITTSQTIQPTCVNQNTGTLGVSASGGVGPYTFAWSNGGTASTISNIPAGNYSVTVTDNTGCSFMKYINLAPLNNWAFYTYTQASTSNCNHNGTITAAVYGGSPPFSFLWNNGSTTQNLTGLASGTYTLTVTDALGCPAIGTATVPSVCYSIISGQAFNDLNGNCTFDAGEDSMQGIYILATQNGQSYYGSAGANGHYQIQVPTTGTFTLTASNYYYSTCGTISLCGNPNQTVTIVTGGDTSANNNFGFVGASGFNLDMGLSWSAGNPGFSKQYRIMPFNSSLTNFTGPATVTFNYDPILIYQSSNYPATNDLANHTVTWVLDSISAYYWNWYDRIEANFLVPIGTPLGYMLQSHFNISPEIGDCDPSNNSESTTQAVTGSYDPNEKIVEPAGRITEDDSILTYTIGFQNTGTDSTHFIILKDTLSASLDPGTVRNIASSHPFSEFAISGKGILTWTFNPLRLVDSFTNEKESHGFVKFSVKKKANMPIGSVISNTAHIYFDYNPAVVTNTVADTISEPNSIFEISSTDGISVKAYPNPFSKATNIMVTGLEGKFDFELFDVTGRMERKITAIENRQFRISRDNMPTGVYFFKILSSDKKKAGYGKLVVE